MWYADCLLVTLLLLSGWMDQSSWSPWVDRIDHHDPWPRMDL